MRAEMVITLSYSISFTVIAAILLVVVLKRLGTLKISLNNLESLNRPNLYPLDHLVGQNIGSYLPTIFLQPPIRFLLLVTPSCGSCYETMEEITQKLTHGAKPEYLKCLLLNESEEHIDYFLKRYASSFDIEVIDPSIIDELEIKILPCILRVDDHGNIDEATIHIWRMEAFLKGGEKDAKHVG
ncbi:hypothetical protein [Brevibacillus reuszeri]|uniref:hypothetical protein n=1 Tax=Brevibacillus reuszeri TaxID=54915 RepID=UPI0013E00956|nr:hypothetical protein [Brevibacillus reuszeri]